MIYLDVDGVLADFNKGALAVHKQLHLLEQPGGYPTSWSYYADWELTEDQFWEPIHELGEYFWANLEPYPWIDEVLSAVERVEPNFRIATAPSRSPYSASGKLHWLTKYVGIGVDRTHISTLKSDLSKSGRLLIDDADHNYRGWQEHGGTCCLFPQPWNTNRRRVDSRMRAVTSHLDSYQKKKEQSLA